MPKTGTPLKLNQAIASGLSDASGSVTGSLVVEEHFAAVIAEHVREFIANRVQAAKFKQPRAEEILQRIFEELTR